MKKRNIKMMIAYDGTQFSGWQVQPEKRTVQKTLQNAVEQVLSHKINLYGAGRTDAGVHARAQGAHFFTKSGIQCDQLQKALNAHLDTDVRVVSLENVALDFHARYSAKWKEYVYTIDTGTDADVFSRLYAWHCDYTLGLKSMQHVAAALCGEHDFAPFAAKREYRGGTVRTLMCCAVSRKERFIRIRMRANGFLYKMARFITGTLVRAGRDGIDPKSVPDMFADSAFGSAGYVAPAKGLCLEKIAY